MRYEIWRAGNLFSAASLPSNHGYGHGLATVTVLLMVSLDGDLIYDLGDLETRLRMGEWLLACVVTPAAVSVDCRYSEGRSAA